MKTIYDKNKAPIVVDHDMDKRVLRWAIIVVIVLIAIWNCPLAW